MGNFLGEHILVVLLRCDQSEVLELMLAHKVNSIDVKFAEWI